MSQSQIENLNALPAGWIWTTIGDVTKPIQKVDPKDRPDWQFNYLDISSVDNTMNRVTDPKTYYGKDAPSRAQQLVNAGDVLFSTVRTYLKNIATVPETYHGQIASTGFSVLRGEESISSSYLFYYSLSDNFLSALEVLQRGTSYPAVRDGDIRVQKIPLAPLPEQQRIVAAIETHFTRLDTAVAGLHRLQANLKRYRAAVLKAACEGRLVDQDPADEPATQLLARILAERRSKWQVENPGKKYQEPIPPDTSNLPELPKDWVWANIGYIFDVRLGSTPSRNKAEYWNGDIPWVSSGEVAFGRIKSTNEYISQSGFANSSVKLNPPGTVLLAMIGEGKTRGQAAILDIPATNNQNVAAILCSQTEIPAEWVFWWLMSRYEQTRRSGMGGMQPALNSERVKALFIPLAPLAEMQQILIQVEKLTSNLDQLEKAIRANLARAARLRQSILKRAFSGRLVPQDPNDEPASVLLDRICAQRKRIIRNS